MIALLKMDFLMNKRNAMSIAISVGMSVFFFLIFSSLYMSTLDETIQAKVIKNYLLTMTAFNMSAFGFFNVPTMLVEDRSNNWLQLLSHTPVKMWYYYTSKMLRIMSIFLVAIIVNFTVGITLKNVVFSFSELIIFPMILLACSVFYISCGLLMSLIQSTQLISVIGNALFFSLAIFGASWMPVELFPEWMQSIAKVTPTYYINDILKYYANSHTVSLSAVLIVAIYTIIILGITLVLKKRSEVK